jgi:membrane protein DedA with SNARE-associated domain
VLQQFAQAVQGVVSDLGYPGLFLMVFLESTLVPIPSLLVFPFAGYLAQQGVFLLPVILVINSVGALAGSLFSYWLGVKGGKPFLLKFGKYFFIKPSDIDKTEAFFAKYGARAILIGRFVPVVRHVQSVPAGIARMPVGKFAIQTAIGSTIWGGGLMILGYVLGAHWQDIATKAKKIDLVIAVVIVLVIAGLAAKFVMSRRKERAAGVDSTGK